MTQDENIVEAMVRRRNVDDAIIASGLGFYISSFEPENPHFVEAIDMFHEDIQLTLGFLNTLVFTAEIELTRNPPRPQLPSEGAIKIDTGAMGACLIVMGNVLPKTVANEGRAYSNANLAIWGKMVHAIWQVTWLHHEHYLDARAWFSVIMAALIDATIDDGCPFLCDNTLLTDTMFLVCFTLVHAGQWKTPANVRYLIFSGSIEEPLRLSHTGSEMAVRQAEQFAIATFDFDEPFPPMNPPNGEARTATQ